MSKINSLLMPFEIGDLFFTTNNTNPSNRFGGTWELYAKGKTIVGIDPNDTDFNAIGKTGGSKADYLSNAYAKVGRSSESITSLSYKAKSGSGTFDRTQSQGLGFSGSTATITDATELGGSVSTLQPYIVSYIWIKTA